jgi:hypothetical protein
VTNIFLLAVRADLNTPLLPSNTDAEREAELTKLNGKLYTVEKAQFNKGCPAVASASSSSVAVVGALPKLAWSALRALQVNAAAITLKSEPEPKPTLSLSSDAHVSRKLLPAPIADASAQ